MAKANSSVKKAGIRRRERNEIRRLVLSGGRVEEGI